MHAEEIHKRFNDKESWKPRKRSLHLTASSTLPLPARIYMHTMLGVVRYLTFLRVFFFVFYRHAHASHVPLLCLYNFFYSVLPSRCFSFLISFQNRISSREGRPCFSFLPLWCAPFLWWIHHVYNFLRQEIALNVMYVRYHRDLVSYYPNLFSVNVTPT